MQSVELRDRPSFGEEICIEMPGHDFLQHVCEQISFVVARREGFNRCAELLKLLGRKAAQGWQREVKRRNFGLHRHDLNFRPDSRGLACAGEISGVADTSGAAETPEGASSITRGNFPSKLGSRARMRSVNDGCVEKIELPKPFAKNR